jgi:UDP-glucose 4-epimerase
MNIGITGAAGYLGTYLTKYFSKSREHNIYGLTRDLDKVNINNINWIIGDLSFEKTCKELIEKSDVIIHLAHTNSPINSNQDFYTDTIINLIPNLMFLEKIRKSNKDIHIVYASSGGAIYENSNPSEKNVENSYPQPSSSYGVQKLTMEHYIRLTCQRSNITSNILRISNLYGLLLPEDRKQGLIGVAFNKIISNKKVQIFGNPNNVRDYVHIKDVSVAFEKAIVQKKGFSLFNIASGESYSVVEVIDLIKEITNIDIKIEYIDIDDSDNLVRDVSLDISNANKNLDWRPIYKLKDGLVEMWKIYSK